MSAKVWTVPAEMRVFIGGSYVGKSAGYEGIPLNAPAPDTTHLARDLAAHNTAIWDANGNRIDPWSFFVTDEDNT